jgi:cytoskeletal protein RodZ
MADSTILGLASRRQKKAISLEQISQTTKIGVRALQAIEAGEFKKLPGGVYTTSYIRQYAKAIDMDESQILALYYSVMGIKPELEEIPERPAEAPASFVSRFLRHTYTVLGSLSS